MISIRNLTEMHVFFRDFTQGAETSIKCMVWAQQRKHEKTLDFELNSSSDLYENPYYDGKTHWFWSVPTRRPNIVNNGVQALRRKHEKTLWIQSGNLDFFDLSVFWLGFWGEQTTVKHEDFRGFESIVFYHSKLGAAIVPSSIYPVKCKFIAGLYTDFSKLPRFTIVFWSWRPDKRQR